MCIVGKYKIYLHSPRNRKDKLASGSIFVLFLKLLQTNLIFDDNVRRLHYNSQF